MPSRLPADYDAVVLAGGEGRRLGGVDKAGIRIGEVTLLDRAISACARASRVVVVGPTRSVRTPDRAVLWARESPPGGGPVAALAVGLGMTTAEVVVLLGVDTPFVTARVVDQLVAALPADGTAGADGALLVGPEGRDQPLVGAYRRAALVRALAAIAEPAGAALRRVVGALDLVRLPDADEVTADCDTPAQLERARARARAETEGGLDW